MAADYTQIEINLEKSAEYTVEIFDAVGKKTFGQTYSGMSGKNILPITTSTLPGGMYHVRVLAEGISRKRRLVGREIETIQQRWLCLVL